MIALLAALTAHGQSYERYAPIGDAALLDIFDRYGYDAGWRLRSLLDLDEEVDVLVLDLSAVQPTDEQWEHLEAWVRAGAVMVVGGTGAPFSELGVSREFETCTALEPAFERAGLPLPKLPGTTLAFGDGETRTLVGCRDDLGEGAAVALLDLDAGVVVAIADPALLWNGAFVNPDNERFVGELVYLGQGLEGWPVHSPAKVQLATSAATSAPSSGGGGGNNPFAALANAGLLAFVLQLIATWVLLSLWRGWPFAPLRDTASSGRDAFSAHAEALGTRYWRLRADGHAAKQVAGFWLARLGPEGLRRAAERASHTPANAAAFAARTEALAEGTEPATMADAEAIWAVVGSQRSEP